MSYLALAVLWNLLAGYAGLLSLGQQAFIGFSGYTVAVLTGYYGLDPWVGVLAGGISAVLLALLMSVFIFRMRGVYFAIGTWLFAETLRLGFGNWAYVNYAAGLFIKPETPIGMNTLYLAALAMAVLSVAGAYAVLKSRIGLGLMAMRDDEDAAETMGVNVLRTKLLCFLAAAFFTGLTAGLLYLFQVFIQPYEAFSIDWTVKLFFMVIIGGIGTVEGPIVGAFIYVLTSQLLSEYGALSTILPGTVAVATMLAALGGIMGTLKEKTGWVLLSHRRS
jgi:branched-chain amino acid transport system permease protein